MRRPLGCLTGTGLVALVLSAVVLIAAAIATGNGIFSPGSLNAERGQRTTGGVVSHAELEGRCEACHPAPWAAQRMTDLCLACHTDVAAEIASGDGLHGLLERTGACRDCHTEHHGPSAPITIAAPTGFPHDRTGYVLTAHQTRGDARPFACADCHVATLASFAQATCLECHQGLDAAMMTPHVATFGADCLACHDGIDTYGHGFNHGTYPLLGRHEDATCGACHEGARTIHVLRSTSVLCLDCHRAVDIHEQRLGPSCGECHGPATWSDAEIDHDRTAFKLTGAHVDAACAGCHVNRQWAGIGMTCVACHRADDAHDGAFGTNCAACHQSTGWNDASFDHSRTAFKLTGAHVDVRCQRCHSGGTFSGTPSTCVSCHARPATHTRPFTGCAACHGTSAWRPARFAVTHSFPVRHGNAGGVCSRCHPSTWASWTCASCHAPSRMATRHAQVADYTPTGCVRCHPRGGGD